jgi:peptide/nickel transport system permease protein
VLPAGGIIDVRAGYTGIDAVIDRLRHLVLPVLALGIRFSAVFLRLTRSSLLDVSSEDYILTAMSKGLSQNVILFRHALRNALRPVVNYLSMETGLVFGRTVLVEVVFSWPGMGRLMYGSLLSRDYPLTISLMMLTAIVVVVANLITDVLYPLLDPRTEIR